MILDLAIEQCLAKRFGQQHPILELKREPSEYHSSFAIENLKIVLKDSTELEVVFKNLGSDGLLSEARSTKPKFIQNPMREICVYTTILAAAGLGTATCYGFTADPSEDQYWLFIEKIRGIELYQVGDLAAWQHAAEWLARMHQGLKTNLTSMRARCHLLNYDPDFYRLWMSRAQTFHAASNELNSIAARYERLISRLERVPATFIHGEFYASNVIVAESSGRWRVVPIDWEMAAIGPALMDLAALTAGLWTDRERRDIALAYWSGSIQKSAYAHSFDQFLEALEYCRLHLCVQWLGWAPQWTPPKEHAQDWMQEAVRIAERLQLL